MKTVQVTVDDRVENVEVPDTGDGLFDEAVALLKLAGTTHLSVRGHIDRVCGNIAMRYASPEIGSDLQKWQAWQRKRGITSAKNSKSCFQPVLKALSGK